MSLLPCHQCGHGYRVEGHPSGQVYICPRCRDDLDRGPTRSPFEGLSIGATPTSAYRAWVDGVRPATPDLAAQLAAVTAERDRAIADRNHLADGLAHAERHLAGDAIGPKRRRRYRRLLARVG